ncbi:unnamed protein product [Clavelina lepadiformis]|uniref:Uncharacterized protein n=1 Tax=Clavelina lepadiformis TaxID=159417 RepID=A0ABP0F0N4_CLALP
MATQQDNCSDFVLDYVNAPTDSDDLCSDSTGSQLLSSSETNTKEWRLEFPIPFKLAPKDVQVKVVGSRRYPDKFQVQSVVPDEQGFDFVVKRTDNPTNTKRPIQRNGDWNSPSPLNLLPRTYKFQVQSVVADEQGFDFVVKRTDNPTSGWGQSPTLTWVAVGDEQAAPTGSQNIGSSEFENLQVRVNFMNSLQKVPKVYAWVRGSFQYQDTFKVFGIKADVNGFSCTVKRTDKSHGWGQNPTIYYNLSGCE